MRYSTCLFSTRPSRCECPTNDGLLCSGQSRGRVNSDTASSPSSFSADVTVAKNECVCKPSMFALACFAAQRSSGRKRSLAGRERVSAPRMAIGQGRTQARLLQHKETVGYSCRETRESHLVYHLVTVAKSSRPYNGSRTAGSLYWGGPYTIPSGLILTAALVKVVARVYVLCHDAVSLCTGLPKYVCILTARTSNALPNNN